MRALSFVIMMSLHFQNVKTTFESDPTGPLAATGRLPVPLAPATSARCNWSHPIMNDQDIATTLTSAAERVPLVADGKSGSVLERVVSADGRRLIAKHISSSRDWIMRATNDPGRAGLLWTSGVLARIPTQIDHAVIGASREADGWVLLMRDVSASLIPEVLVLDRTQSRRILAALADLHNAFRGEPIEGLCSLEDRFGCLSPATAEREREATDQVPHLIRRGWDLFPELVPSDVAEAVSQILERPSLLADRLQRYESTLIHGDAKIANVGLTPERVVLIDWGGLTGIAPPSVEFAWYLATNAHRISATREELIDDFRAFYDSDYEEDALRLGLLGAVVQLGWNKAIEAIDNPDELIRAREIADLQWWSDRAQEGLDVWSPI